MKSVVKNKLTSISVGTFTFLSAFVISFMIGSLVNHIEDSYADTISATVKDTSRYVKISTVPVDIDIDANLEGVLATGVDNLSVETNAEIYKIYLSAQDDTDDAKKLWLNGSSSSGFSFAAHDTVTDDAITNIDDATELAVNTWGFTVSTAANPTTFFGLRSRNNATLIIDETNAGGSTVTNTHPVTYGIKADLSVPAGTYSTTVVYSVVAEGGGSRAAGVTPATVYDDEVGASKELTIVTSLMTTDLTDDWTVTLTGVTNSSTLVDCSSPIASVPNNNVTLKCTIPANLATDTYTIEAVSTKYGTYTTTEGALKYNVAHPVPFNSSDPLSVAPNLDSAVYMTQVTANTCANTSGGGGEVHNLIDARDYKAYQVRKIGNLCWMVQNLALEGDIEVTSRLSNVASNFILPTSSNSTSNYYSSVSANTTKSMYNGTHIGKGDTNGNITETPAADNTSTNTGAYYTWEVATAGTGSGKTTQYQNTIYSICPRGWRLPSFNNSDGATAVGGDFGALTSLSAWGSWSGTGSLTSTGFKDFGNAYTSLCNSGGCPISGYLGSYSYWWSSTVGSSTYAYRLYANSSDGLLANYGNRAFGFQVRCVIGNL